jgi:hypothetical protein
MTCPDDTSRAPTAAPTTTDDSAADLRALIAKQGEVIARLQADAAETERDIAVLIERVWRIADLMGGAYRAKVLAPVEGLDIDTGVEP